MHYSEVMAEGAIDALEAIADHVVRSGKVKVLVSPRSAMVMVRHVDPLQKMPFNLGEALVTECEVEVDGRLGYGCCLGRDGRRALYAALVDAAVAESTEPAGGLAGLLREEAERIESRRERERKAVSATKVDFDVR